MVFTEPSLKINNKFGLIIIIENILRDIFYQAALMTH